MGQTVYEIVLQGEDYFHCDDDGYVMVFDTPEQILEWARANGIDPDTITYYQDEVIEDTEIVIESEEL